MDKNELYLDGLLLEALRKNDEKALGYLFNNYYNKLYRIGLKWCLDSNITEGWRSGASMYLTKPFNPNELLMWVKRIFEEETRQGEERYEI